MGLVLAHLSFGANQTVAALFLTAMLAAGAAILLATPLRRGLASVPGFDAVMVLLALTLALAGLSLTPLSLGGAHPVWAWAGVTPGAGTIDRSATILEMIKLMGLVAAFLIGALQGARKDRAQWTFEAIVWIGGAYAVVSLVMFGARLQIGAPERLSGGFLSANSAATVFGVLTILALGLFLRAWRRAEGLGSSQLMTRLAAPVACLLLGLACLVLTASRMGIAATGAAAAELLVWELVQHRRGRRGVAVAALGAAIAAGVLVTGASSSLLDRFGTVGADLDIRRQALIAHWDVFLTSPLTGSGLGTFDTVNLQSLTPENVDALWSIRAAHNVYLQWLEEAGILGAAPMFLLIGWVIVQALRQSAASRSGRTLSHALIVSSLVVLIHGFVDFGLQVPSIAAFWSFLLGLQFAWGAQRR